MDGCGVSVPIGVHAVLGGQHDGPTAGDMLCEGVAACHDSAIRVVANPMGIELEARVTASVNMRGTMGIDSTVPVGLQTMSCNVRMKVKAPISEILNCMMY